MVTIYDIAKACNTSHATVIRALKNQPHVNDETRRRVKLAAQELGYRPSHAGKLLKSGKTHTIGLVLPDFANPYYVEFLRSIEGECFARGYQVVAIEFAMDAGRERLCLEQMLERRCDGVIFFPSRVEPLRDLFNEFWARKIPCVVIGWEMDQIDNLTVHIDPGIHLAVDHLVGLGHRNIVLFGSWPAESGVGTVRRNALKEAFEKLGLPFRPANVFSRYTGNQLHDGQEGIKELLEKQPETTAIIGVNDYLVSGVMRGLSQLKVRVPEDISLVGTDNTWIGQNWPVALTSIDLKTADLGQQTTQLLFERLENDIWDRPQKIGIDSGLAVRESTGPVRITQE